MPLLAAHSMRPLSSRPSRSSYSPQRQPASFPVRSFLRSRRPSIGARTHRSVRSACPCLVPSTSLLACLPPTAQSLCSCPLASCQPPTRPHISCVPRSIGAPGTSIPGRPSATRHTTSCSRPRCTADRQQTSGLCDSTSLGVSTRECSTTSSASSSEVGTLCTRTPLCCQHLHCSNACCFVQLSLFMDRA